MIATDTPKRAPKEPIPAGMQVARAYAAVDLGTHHDDKFDKDRREIIVIFEVPKHRITIERDGEEPKDLPRAISQRYTLSLNEKANLRKHLESWRGRGFTADELKGFDLRNILGKPCLLNITHNSTDRGTFANISSITPLMDGMDAPAQENPSTFFTFDDYDGGPMPEGMPNWCQEIAKESQEYQAIVAPKSHATEPTTGAPVDEPANEVDEEETPF